MAEPQGDLTAEAFGLDYDRHSRLRRLPVRAATIAAIALMLMAGAASAQTTAPVSSPIAEFQVSPRFWYVFTSNGPPIGKSNPLAFSTSNGAEFALGGAAISLRFNNLPDTTFILSALYGTNDPSPPKNQFLLVSPAGAFSTTVTTHTNRLDLEFLAQTAIPQSSWAWIAGGRFERHEVTLDVRNLASSGLKGPVVASTGTSSGASSNFTLKGGIAGALPLTQDGRLSLFGNIMIAAGVSATDGGPDNGIVGPELGLGLQYAFSPTISADVRYRGIIYYLFDAPPSLPQYVVQQGPMIEAKIKF